MALKAIIDRTNKSLKRYKEFRGLPLAESRLGRPSRLFVTIESRLAMPERELWAEVTVNSDDESKLTRIEVVASQLDPDDVFATGAGRGDCVNKARASSSTWGHASGDSDLSEGGLATPREGGSDASHERLSFPEIQHNHASRSQLKLRHKNIYNRK